ncbi:MAG: hypothetical protein AB7L76_02380 [Burkholderiaceae bacterium]
MNPMHVDTLDTQSAGANPLIALFDSTQALAAAERLYAQHGNGLRFFCENRRTVSVAEAHAMAARDAAADSADA